MAFLQLNKAIHWRGGRAKDGETLRVSKGFLPAGHEVPGGLSVAGRAERQARDAFLTCSVSADAGRGSVYIEREGTRSPREEREPAFTRAPDAASSVGIA